MATKDYIELTGSNFDTFPKNESFYPTDAIGINVDLFVDDWSSENNGQIVGNYGNQGYGLFLESGQTENYLLNIVDCGNNQLLTFNNDCGYSVQRNLPTTNITS